MLCVTLYDSMQKSHSCLLKMKQQYVNVKYIIRSFLTIQQFSIEVIICYEPFVFRRGHPDTLEGPPFLWVVNTAIQKILQIISTVKELGYDVNIVKCRMANLNIEWFITNQNDDRYRNYRFSPASHKGWIKYKVFVEKKL